MRVEVNSELCQGHNRCYALAPELFDVDDYGNAVVIGDGDGAARARGQGAAGVRQLPGVRDHDRRGRTSARDRRPAPADRSSGRPTSTTPTRRTTPTPTRSGTSCAARGCPVAHSPRYGGMWAPITHELVHEVAYDTEHFTSNGVIVSNARPGIAAPVGPAPPITSDPPFHQIARRLLLPPFSPKSIDPWEPDVRRLCNELARPHRPGRRRVTSVDRCRRPVRPEHPGQRDRPHARLPARGRGGLPRVRAQRDRAGRSPGGASAKRTSTSSTTTSTNRSPSTSPTRATTSPRICSTSSSTATGWRYEHVRGSIVLLLIAGIDTTWSAIGVVALAPRHAIPTTSPDSSTIRT